MKDLPAKRCYGFVKIFLIFLKDGAELLQPVLTDWMIKIFEKKAPEQWKIARILPLHKKGKKDEMCNYRPISNLCSMSKIYEKLILMRITEIKKIESADLTGDSQY